MSLDNLTAQLPSERKPENRVLTVILCGDDERALQFVHNVVSGQPPCFSSMPGAAAGLDMNATMPSAPVEEEQPVELPDSEEEMGGFKIPGFVRSAKKNAWWDGFFIDGTQFRFRKYAWPHRH
jgi:hypothetical protein